MCSILYVRLVAHIWNVKITIKQNCALHVVRGETRTGWWQGHDKGGSGESIIITGLTMTSCEIYKIKARELTCPVVAISDKSPEPRLIANTLFANIFETNMKIVERASRRTLFRLANMFANI